MAARELQDDFCETLLPLDSPDAKTASAADAVRYLQGKILQRSQ